MIFHLRHLTFIPLSCSVNKPKKSAQWPQILNGKKWVLTFVQLFQTFGLASFGLALVCLASLSARSYWAWVKPSSVVANCSRCLQNVQPATRAMNVSGTGLSSVNSVNSISAITMMKTTVYKIVIV